LFLFIVLPFSVHLVWIFTADVDRYTRRPHPCGTVFVAGLFIFPKHLSKTFHIALYHAVSASTWQVAHFFLPRLQTFCTARCQCFSKVSGKRADPCCR
jgi:hypothetical protein